MVAGGGAGQSNESVSNETGTQGVNPQPPLSPFFPLVLAGHAGKGSPFVGRVQQLNCIFFFFTPCFCQASLIRGLRLAEHCCRKSLFMPYPPPPYYSPSLPPSLSFQRTTMALRKGRISTAHRADTSCRTTWRRAQSGKRVSLRGPGWGTVRGCRTRIMAILRESHASFFE